MMARRLTLLPHVRTKPITRRSVLSRREALTAEQRAAASAIIARRAAGLLVGDVVALYYPKGSEVDIRSLDADARVRGLRVVYPRLVEAERTLVFCAVRPEELVPSRLRPAQPAVR